MKKIENDKRGKVKDLFRDGRTTLTLLVSVLSFTGGLCYYGNILLNSQVLAMLDNVNSTLSGCR